MLKFMSHSVYISVSIGMYRTQSGNIRDIVKGLYFIRIFSFYKNDYMDFHDLWWQLTQTCFPLLDIQVFVIGSKLGKKNPLLSFYILLEFKSKIWCKIFSLSFVVLMVPKPQKHSIKRTLYFIQYNKILENSG